MFVVGTAGHVDHGKSTLVEALIGIDPDQLPSGSEVSIVDVPGHERFVNNMLAGVGGIDLALLIVACDESVMPQTREYLAILDFGVVYEVDFEVDGQTESHKFDFYVNSGRNLLLPANVEIQRSWHGRHPYR